MFTFDFSLAGGVLRFSRSSLSKSGCSSNLSKAVIFSAPVKHFWREFQGLDPRVLTFSVHSSKSFRHPPKQTPRNCPAMNFNDTVPTLSPVITRALYMHFPLENLSLSFKNNIVSVLDNGLITKLNRTLPLLLTAKSSL